MEALCWVGREWRAGAQGQVTLRGEMEGRALRDRLDEEVREGPGAGEWDWTSETCRAQQSDLVILIKHIGPL